ncbi:very short patch repair endonuclease [Agrobacterium pusense]|uniref:very short patch repair endonuclease n=1 Tax=Agrobacterium TaxID=357 RepID=UPI000D35482B|nr:DNA mismatch endonuclease Vsr [Agrobacterium pusense]PTV72491.1 very short patch repair endonuclease [Agrobacterium pusense]
MPDTLTIAARSERMSRVKGKNTKPEITVRKLIHGLGFRYRLHGRDIPGKPDIVFSKRRKVVFVHGCFWHRHTDSSCSLARLPKSRLDFWLPKLERNAQRDGENLEKLAQAGWRSLVIWECELRDKDALKSKVMGFLCDEVN